MTRLQFSQVNINLHKVQRYVIMYSAFFSIISLEINTMRSVESAELIFLIKRWMHVMQSMFELSYALRRGSSCVSVVFDEPSSLRSLPQQMPVVVGILPGPTLHGGHSGNRTPANQHRRRIRNSPPIKMDICSRLNRKRLIVLKYSNK